jgi:hypothetical protein
MNLPVRLFLIRLKKCDKLSLAAIWVKTEITICLAAAENGEIFWVEGLRISENFKLTRQTKRRLTWRWRRLAGFSKGI